MQRHKVILDIDNATGMPMRDIDDGVALALALASPDIELPRLHYLWRQLSNGRVHTQYSYSSGFGRPDRDPCRRRANEAFHTKCQGEF